MEAVIWIVGIAIFIFPFWKALSKAGMNPAISLIALFPLLGWPLALRIFAKGKWPNVDTDLEAGA